jgi:hypothetical protein
MLLDALLLALLRRACWPALEECYDFGDGIEVRQV